MNTKQGVRNLNNLGPKLAKRNGLTVDQLCKVGVHKPGRWKKDGGIFGDYFELQRCALCNEIIDSRDIEW